MLFRSVLGAISLVIQNPKLKYSFYGALVVGSLVGTWYGFQAFQVAMSVG